MVGRSSVWRDRPLEAQAADWSEAELTALHTRLAHAVTVGAQRVDTVLDAVPETPRNVAAVLEHLVDQLAGRAQQEGRAAAVVRAPLPDEAVERVGHLLVVRWLTRRHADGRRVIRYLSHAPVSGAAATGRTSRLLVTHLSHLLVAEPARA